MRLARVNRRAAGGDLDLHLSVSAQLKIFGRQLDIYDWPGDP